MASTKPTFQQLLESLIQTHGTNSFQYVQAILDLVRRCGNPKYVVSAFIAKGLYRIRKLIHNFELNGL